MARLKNLPSLDIIRGFRGVIDFYVYKGIPCARRWPRHRPGRQTAPSRASAAIFGAIVSAFGLTSGLVKALFDEDAADQPRTGRDIYVSAVLGHLHEASMSDFLDLLTECRDFLSDLTALTDALQSVDTDRLQVRGSDQLISLKAGLWQLRTAVVSGANGYVDSPVVGAGEFWIVTTICSFDSTRPTTGHYWAVVHDGTAYWIGHDLRPFATAERDNWRGVTYLDTGDYIRCYFTNSQAGDSCTVVLTGHRMTVET